MHNERLDDHQKFRELAALAQRGAISDIERLELDNHLRVCLACRQVFDEYSLLSTVGIPFLAASSGSICEGKDWDDGPVRARLLARVRRTEECNLQREKAEPVAPRNLFALQNATSRWSVAAVAACVLIAIAVGTYHMGARKWMAQQQPLSTPSPALPSMSNENKTNVELIAAQRVQLSRLEAEYVREEQEVSRLRGALQAAENHSAALASTEAKREEQLRQISAERDKLAAQLRDAEQSYQLVQAELTTLRAEHEKVLLRTTSLESKIEELDALARDRERRLKDDEQFLSSDRDIRELMGARKLYIADVFDVDSGSRTRKPFGRVFYTQNKSLIFYAFDLDRQPGVKTASAFQVWGQRDTGAEEKNHATNLGILYMDSETNRRWVLRLDDPKQLAEIDAVFVTVEPHGGSQKPTGKPFLYALLRREANHP
jgi:hypothetical protein